MRAGSGAGEGRLSSQPCIVRLLGASRCCCLLYFHSYLYQEHPHSDTLILVLHTLLLKGLHCLRSSIGTWISKSSDLKSFNSTSPHPYIGFLAKQ